MLVARGRVLGWMTSARASRALLRACVASALALGAPSAAGAQSLDRIGRDVPVVEQDVDKLVQTPVPTVALRSPTFVEEFPCRIINLHPALLPAFPGTTSISDAVRYGVKVTGVTVHFVDEGLDTGPVIAQEPVRVNDEDTAESLAERIHEVEHRLLPATIRLIATGRVRTPLPGTRVVQVDWGGDDSRGT